MKVWAPPSFIDTCCSRSCASGNVRSACNICEPKEEAVTSGEAKRCLRAHLRIAVPLLPVLAWIIISPAPRLSRPASEPSKQLPSNTVDTPSLYKSLAGYFPVGAAVWQGSLMGPHSELLAKHFNSVVAENAMKLGPLQHSEGVFDFTEADAIVNFAKAHHMRIRGTTLVWHEQNPAWLFKDASGNDLLPGPESKALVLARLRAHIGTVLSRYKD